jgi:preprotein translocase subunit SecB
MDHIPVSLLLMHLEKLILEFFMQSIDLAMKLIFLFRVHGIKSFLVDVAQDFRFEIVNEPAEQITPLLEVECRRVHLH